MDKSAAMEDALDDLLTRAKTFVQRLLNEEAFSDLPKDVTSEEIKSELQLKYGHSFTVNLVLADGNGYKIIVPSTDTRVSDLKKCIQRQVTVQMRRQGIRKKISWRYIWRAYVLSCEGMKITDENALLQQIGVESQSKITFAKRLNDKVRVRRFGRRRT